MSNYDQVLTEDDEGFHKRDSQEWYYVGAIFDESHPKFANWALVCTFLTTRGIREFNSMWLFPPDVEDAIDIGYMDLKPKSLKASKKGVDVQYQNNFFKGMHPDYHLYFESPEKKYIIDLKLKGDTDPKWVTQNGEKVIKSKSSYLHDYFIPRIIVNGTITEEGKAYPVQGDGYYEHVRGFVDPFVTKGWLWIGIPRAEGKGKNLCINIGTSYNLDDTPQEQMIFFTENGEDYGTFKEYKIEKLETAELPHLDYPTKIRLTADEEGTKMDLTITRLPCTYKVIGRELFNLRATFITGPASCSGTLEWNGKTHKLKGIAIASSMYIIKIE